MTVLLQHTYIHTHTHTYTHTGGAGVFNSLAINKASTSKYTTSHSEDATYMHAYIHTYMHTHTHTGGAVIFNSLAINKASASNYTITITFGTIMVDSFAIIVTPGLGSVLTHSGMISTPGPGGVMLSAPVKWQQTANVAMEPFTVTLYDLGGNVANDTCGNVLVEG